jgi:hypothetical protein
MKTLVIVILVSLLFGNASSQVILNIEFAQRNKNTGEVRCYYQGQSNYLAKFNQRIFFVAIPSLSDSLVIEMENKIPVVFVGFTKLNSSILDIMIPYISNYEPVDTLIERDSRSRWPSKKKKSDNSFVFPNNSLKLDSLPQALSVSVNDILYVGILKRQYYIMVSNFSGKNYDGYSMIKGVYASYVLNF